MLTQIIQLLRSIIGWVCIIGGLLLSISPIPFGFLIIIAGVLLVGPRDRGLRRMRAWWNRSIRSLASSSIPWVAAPAQRIIAFQSSIEQHIRRWMATRTPSHIAPPRAAAEE
ncbi:MAG: hypothetical protein ACUVSW_17170 [Roseiflexus sp.]